MPRERPSAHARLATAKRLAGARQLGTAKQLAAAKQLGTAARHRRLAAVLGAVAVLLAGCRDETRFSSQGDHWEGEVTAADFVRTGVDRGTKVCVVLDATRLAEAPGFLSTSDGRFAATRLRPVPQAYHDPLSTLSFGDGRLATHLYAARPRPDGGLEDDVTVVLSLTSNDDLEVRLVRGAPGEPDDTPATAPIFAVARLGRAAGPCPFGP